MSVEAAITTPPQPDAPATSRLFAETALVRKKYRRELIAKCFFGAMAAAMVIPLILIVTYIVVQGAP